MMLGDFIVHWDENVFAKFQCRNLHGCSIVALQSCNDLFAAPCSSLQDVLLAE